MLSIRFIDIKMSDKNSIEKIYQKKSQLEHILLRPDTYIGSVEQLTQEMWIWDFENEKMIKKEITFVPGLYKIFDEILGKKRQFNYRLNYQGFLLLFY